MRTKLCGYVSTQLLRWPCISHSPPKWYGVTGVDWRFLLLCNKTVRSFPGPPISILLSLSELQIVIRLQFWFPALPLPKPVAWMGGVSSR